MTRNALVFMLLAWGFVLWLTFWSWAKLLKVDPKNENPPPPGTSL